MKFKLGFLALLAVSAPGAFSGQFGHVISFPRLIRAWRA